MQNAKWKKDLFILLFTFPLFLILDWVSAAHAVVLLSALLPFDFCLS
jgi:hypothetical protein